MNKQTAIPKVADELAAMDSTPHVYRAISEVQAELAKTGIAKNRTNSQPGANYAFRGIDDVYAALAPLLSRHKLVVVPRVIDRQCEERRSAKGNPLFNVTVRAEFDFVSAFDGSTHTAATYGEAMDSSDKATNKAMSAAYKYAAFMTFAIPTEGDNDADASHHEVVARSQTDEAPARKPVQLDGPYKSPTALKTAAREFVRTLEGMGDLDEFIAWSETSDYREFCTQLEKDMPDWWRGGPSVPAEFVPLEIRIRQRREDLEKLEGVR